MKKNESQQYIAFDVDSSSIGVLVFERKHSEKGKVLHHEVFSHRKQIGNGFDMNFESFFQRTKNTFHELALLAHRYSGANIENIFINLSSPWVSAQKHMYFYEKENDFICTQKIINHLLEKGKKQETHKTRDFSSYNQLDLIDQRVLYSFVNGYFVDQALGEKGRTLDVHTLNTYISEQAKEVFSHLMEQHFHREPVFISNAFVEYSNYKNLFPQDSSAIFIDMSAQITDILCIQDGQLQALGTIPVGSQTLVRELSSQLSVSLSKARSLLELYQNNSLEENFEKNISEAMERTFLVWFKKFYSALGDFGKEYLVPNKILFTGDSFIRNWMLLWMRGSDELLELLPPKKTFAFVDMKKKILSANIAKFEDQPDASLLNLLLFLEKEISLTEKNNGA